MISCMSTSFSPPPSSSNSAVPSARVVSFEEARHLVEQHALVVCPVEGETVELLAKLVEVEVRRSVSSGENFVPRGAEARAGQLLLYRGHRLDHAGIAIAASVGKGRVQVFRKPRVAVLSTGDEVVEIDATPGPAQIRNSNSYSLAAQIQNAGGEAVRLAIAPDERGRLRSLIEEGLDCELLVLTGGVSIGKYDLVEQVLGELKTEFYFTGAQIQPGRPVVFGSCSAGALARLDSGVVVGSGARAPGPHEKYFFALS